MESLIHKTLEDYRYAKRMDDNKFKVFQPNKHKYEGDILDNLNTGSLTKPQFARFVDFIRAINGVSSSFGDLPYSSCEISLQEIKEDMMKARLAYDNLPVICDENGNEIEKPSRDLLSIKIGTIEEVDKYYRDELDGKFDEQDNPLDEERYVYAGLLTNCDDFVENIANGVFVEYLEKVDKATGNSFAKEIPTEFEPYSYGIHNEGCFNENGNLIVHAYRVHKLIHNHEKGAVFEPIEYDMENIKLEDDLVTNHAFDMEADYYLVGRRIHEEREAAEAEKNKVDEQTVEQDTTTSVLQNDEPVVQTQKEESKEMVKEPPMKDILQPPVSVVQTIMVDGKIVESSDDQANTLQKGDMLEHKKFGLGEFQEFNEKGYMIILFESDEEPKVVVPRAFSMGIIKRTDKKKTLEQPKETSQAEALIENRTKPLLYNSSVKEEIKESHTAVMEAVQEQKKSMKSVSNTEIIFPEPMFTEEDVAKTGITVPNVDDYEKEEMKVETKSIQSAIVSPAITVKEPIVREFKPQASEVMVEKPVLQEEVQSVTNELVKATDVKVEPTVVQNVPSAPVVHSQPVQQPVSTVQSTMVEMNEPQHEVKNGRIVVRVFADRMVEDKKMGAVNLFDEESRWVNFRMAYGKYKGYTFGVPDYFVTDSLPVGKDHDVATKKIAFYANWKHVVFKHPTEKNLQVKVPFKEALKLIEADMSPKTATASLAPKRPMMYNRNRGNSLE